MRRGLFSILAAVLAVSILTTCDIQPAGPATTPTRSADPQAVPDQVRAIIEQHGLSDQAIEESAEDGGTECLWPPVTSDCWLVYAITVLWGHLPAVRMPPFPVLDWSGKAGVSNADGVIRVVRTFDFEEGEDALDPIADPGSVSWKSTTAGDFDGLGMLVRIPSVSARADGSFDLAFASIPLAISLPFAKLDRFVAYYPISDTEGVAVLARRVDGTAYPRGYIKGEWLPDADDPGGGYLSGRWYDCFGVPIGSMAGRFWTNADGTGSFEGWLSGVWLTVVLAELKGTWCFEGQTLSAAGREQGGRFAGVFHYLNAERAGTLEGRFGGASRDARALPLEGIWRVTQPIAAD